MPSKTFITNLFDSIASKYDLLNNILSLGTHHLWKTKLVNSIKRQKPQSVLDGATGTGDIALAISEFCPDVTGIDISPNMLRFARHKSRDIKFESGDLTSLKYAENTFDISCVSFGVRNVENLDQCLKELLRVTKNKVYILEFGSPENPIFKSIYFAIMKYFIPTIGKLFSRKEAYTYLIDSSSRFPSGRKFLKHIPVPAGQKRYRPIFGGIVYLYEISSKTL